MLFNSNEPNSPYYYDPEDEVIGFNEEKLLIKNDAEKRFCIGCIVLIIIISIVICVVVYFATESDKVTEYDISKFPFQYQLSLRYLYATSNRYDYVISSLHDHEFTLVSNLTARDVYQTSNNNSTTDSNNSNETNQTELGLLISRSLRLLTPGFYEVQEEMITATASYTTLSYTSWGPPITIKFVTSNQTTSNDLISCEYQFTWTFIVNGYVNRKCKDESEFSAVSYVNGSSSSGFTFYSIDENEIYAYTTIPDLTVGNFFRRNAYINHTSPFPTLIPALYTAYYDYLTN
ncbi:40640_t:CDS:2, partial [Gigaspora margarita]